MFRASADRPLPPTVAIYFGSVLSGIFTVKVTQGNQERLALIICNLSFEKAHQNLATGTLFSASSFTLWLVSFHSFFLVNIFFLKEETQKCGTNHKMEMESRWPRWPFEKILKPDLFVLFLLF